MIHCAICIAFQKMRPKQSLPTAKLGKVIAAPEADPEPLITLATQCFGKGSLVGSDMSGSMSPSDLYDFVELLLAPNLANELPGPAGQQPPGFHLISPTRALDNRADVVFDHNDHQPSFSQRQYPLGDGIDIGFISPQEQLDAKRVRPICQKIPLALLILNAGELPEMPVKLIKRSVRSDKDAWFRVPKVLRCVRFGEEETGKAVSFFKAHNPGRDLLQFVESFILKRQRCSRPLCSSSSGKLSIFAASRTA